MNAYEDWRERQLIFMWWLLELEYVREWEEMHDITAPRRFVWITRC
jgi:hypothetical protein